MKNLIFKKLVVVSDTRKLGNQFQFHPRLNLITANSNSFGKSTLAKLLVWTLGAEPELDDTWKSFDVRCLVDFIIGDCKYQIGRYKNTMFLHHPNGEKKIFTEITGEYTEVFSKIVGFEVLLSKRGSKENLEIPPPSFYFLPFYIDQKRSWLKAWDGFNELKKYLKWEEIIIQYHTGYLHREFFSIQKKVLENDIKKEKANSIVKKINNTFDVISEYLPTSDNIVSLSKSEMNKIEKEILKDIRKLRNEQEGILQLIAKNQERRLYLKSQLDLVSNVSKQLEDDYIFSVECIEGETLFCPLCGTVHDNSAPQRASILADKNEADRQIKDLREQLEKLNKDNDEKRSQLAKACKNIEAFNKKYKISNDSENYVDTESIFPSLNYVASHTIKEHVEKVRLNNSKLIKNINTENKNLRKKLDNILEKNNKDSLDSEFIEKFRLFIQRLDVQEVDWSHINSPLDYEKLYGNGGAADFTRGILAYYISILLQIQKAGNEVFSPIIIDTPNQQEQSQNNYRKILSSLIESLPNGGQLILCAMHRPEIQRYGYDMHVIELDEQKILKKSVYKECRELLHFMNQHQI